MRERAERRGEEFGFLGCELGVGEDAGVSRLAEALELLGCRRRLMSAPVEALLGRRWRWRLSPGLSARVSAYRPEVGARSLARDRCAVLVESAAVCGAGVGLVPALSRSGV
jgi:hypothetical protein